MSKIILIGERLKLGEKFNDRSLIVPTLYKTVVFTFFTLIFTFLEHFVLGYIHGIDFAKLYAEFIDKGIDVDLAKLLVVFLVFILFFSFKEVGRILGEKTLIKLFFHRKPGETIKVDFIN